MRAFRSTVMRSAVFLACVLLARAADADPSAVSTGPAVLLAQGELTASERAVLDRGGIVAKMIDTSDRSEVFSFTAMRVKTTPSRVLARFRGVEDWQRDPWVLQVARVSPAPSTRDLAALTLDPGDVKQLSRCRVNDCDVRLPAEAIERFRREIDWSSPDRAARAAALFRQTLSSLTASYLSFGNAALSEYANNDEPVRIGESLNQLLLRSRFLGDASPDLYAYLHRFPNDRPETADDFVYWAKERFWHMNVLSVNHSVVVDRPTASGRLILAASKQLYASHYYESSLNLAAYVEGADGGSYLVALNRARADIRPSGFHWIERLLVNRLVRRRMKSEFRYLKESLEAPEEVATGPAGPERKQARDQR